VSFQRVLAAVDFSRDSITGARAAAETARLHSAALLVFHAVDVEPRAAAEPLPGGGEAVLEILDKAHNAMDALIEDIRPVLGGVRFTTEVATGWPEDEIVARAQQWKADLVVLGARGTVTLEDVFLGGVAHGVLQRAPCSVMAVRGYHRETPMR
jgi:nucleotide-binding universal stress UspA family protein